MKIRHLTEEMDSQGVTVTTDKIQRENSDAVVMTVENVISAPYSTVSSKL